MPNTRPFIADNSALSVKPAPPLPSLSALLFPLVQFIVPCIYFPETAPGRPNEYGKQDKNAYYEKDGIESSLHTRSYFYGQFRAFLYPGATAAAIPHESLESLPIQFFRITPF
jgi:hypothetical protein